MLDSQELEQYFSSHLGRQIILSICHEEIQIDELSSRETQRLKEMKHEHKRSSWLRGRQALKTLILRARAEANLTGKEASDLLGNEAELCSSTKDNEASAKKQIDTTCLLLPHPRLSLSHSNELAVAVACIEAASGLGVDIELLRPLRQGSARFFLSELEQVWLSSIDSTLINDELLRLWTVKESLFKSDLQNQGKTLIKYSLEDPSAQRGKAKTSQKDGLSRFTYISRKIDNYWLSIAIAN